MAGEVEEEVLGGCRMGDWPALVHGCTESETGWIDKLQTGRHTEKVFF